MVVDVTVPAWNDSQDYLGLRSLLDVIGANDWTWRLDEFYGTTRADAGVNAVDLEHRLQEGESRSFTWDGLLDFADRVNQLIDGRLIALVPGQAEPALTIEAHDSTVWKITATDGDEPAAAALDRVAALND